jgi:hypothetical protein
MKHGWEILHAEGKDGRLKISFKLRHELSLDLSIRVVRDIL